MGAETGTGHGDAGEVGRGQDPPGRVLKPQPGIEQNTLGEKEPLKTLGRGVVVKVSDLNYRRITHVAMKKPG